MTMIRLNTFSDALLHVFVKKSKNIFFRVKKQPNFQCEFDNKNARVAVGTIRCSLWEPRVER